MSIDSTSPSNVATPAWTPERSGAGRLNPWLITPVIAIPVFMEVLDTSIANVALRHMAGSLAAGTDESTWVVTSYLVANAIIMPISGWLADVMGRKRFFTTCILLFTAASFLCGTATSLGLLILYRVLQGLGGGGMVPCAQAILADSFPPARRGQAFAIFGLAIIVAPVLGPPLGGWITDNHSWPWIFFINIPVGIASAFLSSFILHEPPLLVRERHERWTQGLRLDVVGFALAAVGLACMEVTLSKGEQNDWFASPMIRTFACITGGSLLLMVLWEWWHPDPVVDVHLFTGRTFSACLAVMFASGLLLYSSTTILPMLLQGIHGYTAFLAGLAMMPGGLASGAGMVAVGILTRFVQLRYLVAAGLLLQMVPLYFMSGFTPNLTFSHAAWARFYQMVGLGCLVIPVMTLAYEGLPGSKTNGAACLINIARNIGGSFGISITNTWLAWRSQYHHSVLTEQISAYSATASDTLTGLQTSLQALGAGEDLAQQQALVATDGMVNQQAYVMAFNDVFLLAAAICLGVLLLVFLLPANRPGQGDAAMH
jgi:MFS transporter, DHA2 family, multidrug resistance protein